MVTTKMTYKKGGAVEQSNEVKMNNSLAGVNISTRTVFNPQKCGDKKGFADNDGKWLIHPTYDEVDVFREGVCWVKIGDKWGLINEYGESLIDPRYDDAREFNEGFGTVKVAGKWGVVDKSGNYIFEPQFDIIFHYDEGIAIVKTDDKYGFINIRNKCLIPPIYEYVRYFSEGFAAVVLNGLWGYIDCSGKYIAEPKYYIAYAFREGKGEVLYDNMVGEIDSQGNYREIRKATDDDEATAYYFYKYVYEWDYVYSSSGFIDESGAFVVRPKFERVEDFKDGYARVWLDGKERVINTKGAYINEPDFIQIEEDDIQLDEIFNKDFDDDCKEFPDFKIIKTDGKCGVVDYNGKFIVESKYKDIIWNCEEEVFTVQMEEQQMSKEEENDIFWDAIKERIDLDEALGYRWGILDKNGDIIVEPRYKMYGADLKFSGGLAPIKVSGKWGLIDRLGNLILTPTYRYIDYQVQDGYRIVQTESDTWSLLNEDLHIAFEPINYRITSVNNGKAIIEDDCYRYGFVDCKTGEIVKPQYDNIHYFHEGLAAVEIIEDSW